MYNVHTRLRFVYGPSPLSTNFPDTVGSLISFSSLPFSTSEKGQR